MRLSRQLFVELLKKLRVRKSKEDPLTEDKETIIILGDKKVPISLTANIIRSTIGVPGGIVIFGADISKFKEIQRSKEDALKIANKKSVQLSTKVEELERFKKTLN